jgi:hypothetical protein
MRSAVAGLWRDQRGCFDNASTSRRPAGRRKEDVLVLLRQPIYLGLAETYPRIPESGARGALPFDGDIGMASERFICGDAQKHAQGIWRQKSRSVPWDGRCDFVFSHAIDAKRGG